MAIKFDTLDKNIASAATNVNEEEVFYITKQELNDILWFALYYDEESEDELTEEIKAEIKNEADRRGWKCYIGE